MEKRYMWDEEQDGQLECVFLGRDGGSSALKPISEGVEQPKLRLRRGRR